ncbi:Ger(x)C family spore germination protein [Bacillus xiapuensis]|uniref:Ger(X)C family spore germination protein n=1 Tax=Bacillus xiapuensis TaxID=2014075 RepID=A0ABU6NBF1_9BACI|nr:Ger(x)C family spore germination protein [Bacillus xiapuensis]
MRKKLLCWVFLCNFLLSGCWDQRELSEISVVTGMAIDKSDEGKFSLTTEGISAQELNPKTASGFTSSIIFTLEGDTISELSQKMNVGASKNVIYSHMQTLVIGEEIAKEGLLEFIDFLERNREIRDDFNIIIAHNVKAADILKVTYPIQKSSSLKLHVQLESILQNWGGDPDVRLNDVVQAYTSPGRHPVMAAVTIQGNPEAGGSVDNLKEVSPKAIVILDSLAIFKQGKLLDFLPLEDARNYLWVEGKLTRTALSVPCQEDKYISVRIYNSKTRTKARMIRGLPVININVRSEAYLDGTQCINDITQIKTYEQYEKLTAKMIEKNILSNIKKVQKEYQTDIFGFGEEMYRQDYQNFKKVQDHWDELFSDAIVKVHVKVQLRRSGIRTKSLLSN